MNIDGTLRVVARLTGLPARGRAGLAHASRPAPTLLILLLAVLALAACNPVESRSDSRIRDAVQNFASEERADPSSCVRDFRVLEPKLTRSPQQMDLNAGYYQSVMANNGDVSFLVQGQFPHSILLSWVIYDANGQIYSAVHDQQMTPDPDNINPFLTGAEVLAANRSYTAFFKPEGAPTPDGIPASNVLILPPASENDRIYITMRSYWAEPGYPRVGGPTPTISAVNASDPTQPGVCPGLGMSDDLFPLSPFELPAPEPGRILFFRPPNNIIPMADGTEPADPNGCTGYAMAQLSDTDLNLIKLHKAPTFPDNQNYTLESVWTDDFDVRYVGFEANGATILGPRSNVSMNDIKLQPDGSAIILTVARPSALDAADRLALMEKARAENWNLMISAGEGSEVAPFLTYRNKLAQDSFAYSISAIPCFGPDQGEWANATADFASNPDNMGEYYIDGVICTAQDVLSDACMQQLAGE